MQKTINALLCAALCAVLAAVPLSGVKESFRVQSVEKSAVVKSIGLDEGKSAQISFVQSVIADTSPTHAQALISAEGESFSDAEKQAQILADKYLTLSYTRHLIFGMATAEKGLENALNYLLASPILQLSSYIYVCEGTAQKVLESISEDEISTDEVLTNLNLAGRQEGYYYPVSVLELAKSVSENSCLCVPIIGQKQQGENSAKKTVLVFKGYALLQAGKLKGILSRENARAYNLLSGRLERTVFSGKRADITLTRAKCHKKLVFSGKRLCAVEYDITLYARFAALKSKEAVTERFVHECEAQAQRALEAQVRSLLAWSKRNRADILHLQHEAQVQSPDLRDTSLRQTLACESRVKFRWKTERSYTLNRSV